MANRLQHAASLYLRQHAQDPVDWWPWCDLALALAREQARPILLSIGYSACHWCHVMAKESFADPAIAALLNSEFVSIKVDREELPEVDRVYQLAHQALQRSGGGWPLTAFLDPRTLLPIFIGTYFPPQRRHGLPAFADVLRGIARWFRERPDEIDAQGVALQRFLDAHLRTDPEQGALDAAPLRLTGERWLENADPRFGGRRGAPKFPPAGELAIAVASPSAPLRAWATQTLSAMAAGGLHDLLGGGFFRYCVDEHWGIPHFEKMLSDNALLLPLYAREAAGGDREARVAAEGIVRWLQAEMALPGGGYASALDADSGGEEGGYYLWRGDQLDAVLGADAPPALRRWLGLARGPNADRGQWHLQQACALADLLPEGGDPEALARTFAPWLQRLHAARGERLRPARDDKFLAAANGLLLAGLARAARCLRRADWTDLADALADAIRGTLYPDEQLHALAYAGRGERAGNLDDHAAVLLGLLELLQTRWRSRDLDFAIDLADALLERFEDAEFGGFWLSAHDQPRLPQRPKPWLDEATPSGNGMAAQALQRLGSLIAEPRYLQAAERCLRAGWHVLGAYPEACASLLPALADLLEPPPLLIARFADAGERERWAEALDALCDEGRRVFEIPADAEWLPQALEDKRWLRGGRVYWCEGLRCLPRFDSPAGLLGARGAGRD